MSRTERWFSRRLRQRARTRTVQLNLEALEERQVPTVTYHGGALLPNVEVQGIYYGSGWNNNPPASVGQYEGYLQYLVTGPYMDMLGKAGYNVGRGSDTGGAVVADSLSNVVYDTDIQNMIERNIIFGQVAQPDPNRLYVVFVQPNTEVIGPGGNSVSNFAGYHAAFLGFTQNLNLTEIHYAVVTTPGGTVGNGYINGESYLSQFDEMTLAASHEIAESVTDANVNFSTLGWYDDQQNGEIGDIVNGQSVRLNGYLVQKEADQYDNPMFPTALSFQGNNFNEWVRFQQTVQVAFGSDAPGTTNVNNLVGLVYWGDGNFSFGTFTQDAQGNFVAKATHAYASTGNYQVMVELYDKTNVIQSFQLVYETAHVTYPPPYIFYYAAASMGHTSGSLAGSQLALAAGSASASRPASGVAPMVAASVSGAGPISRGNPGPWQVDPIVATSPSAADSFASAGKPAEFAFDKATQDGQRTDGGAVHEGWNTRLADAFFAANPFDPMTLVSEN